MRSYGQVLSLYAIGPILKGPVYSLGISVLNMFN
jgi:hypothetical protein